MQTHADRRSLTAKRAFPFWLATILSFTPSFSLVPRAKAYSPAEVEL